MFGEGDDEEAREYFPGVNRGFSSSGSGSGNRERSSPISSPMPGTRVDASSSGTLTSASRGRSREGLGSRDSDRGFSPTSNRSAISPYGSGSRSRSVSPSGVRKVGIQDTSNIYLLLCYQHYSYLYFALPVSLVSSELS